MMSIDTFTQIAEEEMALLPQYVYDELNGGVLIDPDAFPHPARMAEDLYILGTYSSSGILGKQIVLYYGSFVITMGHLSDEAVRQQIRDTLRHEFRHHLETRAGLFGKDTLIEEDRDRMIRYYMRHRQQENGSGNTV